MGPGLPNAYPCISVRDAVVDARDGRLLLADVDHACVAEPRAERRGHVVLENTPAVNSEKSNRLRINNYVEQRGVQPFGIPGPHLKEI